MPCYNYFGCNNRMYLYWRRTQSLWFELGKLSIMNYVGNSRNDKMYENKESIGWKEMEGYTNKQYSIIGFLHLQQMWMSFHPIDSLFSYILKTGNNQLVMWSKRHRIVSWYIWFIYRSSWMRIFGGLILII